MLGRSKRITEVRLTPRRLAISRLLSPYTIGMQLPQLHPDRVLMRRRDTGVEADAKRFCPRSTPPPPLESGGEALCIISGLDMRTQPVQKL